MFSALIIDDELLARGVIRTLLQNHPAVTVVSEAANGTEAVIQILQHRPDLVFLDIQMPELNGFEVLQQVWPHHQPAVVFTTAYDQYALRAFDANAIDYLLKPFNAVRFHQALERARERLGRRPQPQLEALVHQQAQRAPYLRRLLVKETGRMYLVDTADVRYFDAQGNYITLHTAGTERHIIYDSLGHLETRLDPADFVRIHRSYIVNLNFVQAVETHFNGEYLVQLRDGPQLKWTRSYRDNLRAFQARQG
ncbi:LytR/AlgR family response regulator transcription factor [Hymenobacter jeollabukensis]|uniref:Response regulator transcription factor n=1 Tax=Hymenobacter jeollabukensis TaxID=2025313 RepID=A0A5R8WJH8_9BACT|nr:LytTR family DNA-binding domain-containing protein [Hymenobacter jeollabukensis]TLM88929.1 response regulator transcription factor [Hymenobacter jeollabukensis]